MKHTDPNCPVIIGIGQQVWRESDPSRTPIQALTQAGSLALADTGVGAIRSEIDCVATVRFIAETNPAIASMFPGSPGTALAEQLHLDSPEVLRGAIGGNSPQYLVNKLGEKLSKGEHSVVLLAGAELFNSFFRALKSGDDLSHWSDGAKSFSESLGEDRDGLNETEKRHGLYEPINTYPLFENALRHHEKRSFAEHQQRLGEICAAMSEVARANPVAWRQKQWSPEEIVTVSDDNRFIGYPYTKRMNAVLSVDMAAAVVMTTVAKALELGVSEDQFVYLRAGVDVNEIWNVSERRDFHSSPGLGMAVRGALAHSALRLEDIDCFDIYSCFPSAVEIACNEIGLSPLDPRGVTITGGLPFFGGPGNNYSLHAIAEMTSRLRSGPASNGLVTANGLYLTKHSVGIYSSNPPPTTWQAFDDDSLQAAIDQGPQVHLSPEYEGAVTVETYTVTYDRNGPKEGIVIALTDEGSRIIANTGAEQTTFEELLRIDPVGRTGYVQRVEGKSIFRF